MNKTKRMLKNAAISVGIGAVPAFVVLWLAIIMKVNETYVHGKDDNVQNTHNDPLMIGITVMLFAIAVLL